MSANFRWGLGPGSHSHAPNQGPTQLHVLVLEALETLVDQPVGAGPDAAVAAGTSVVCRVASELVEAPVAGHVRYDVAHRTCHLLLWRPPEVPVTFDQVEPVGGDAGHDWWTTSTSRRLLLEWLDRPHLAELPLSTEAAAPTLVIVGRDEPFREADSDALAQAHRSLRALERVAERVAQPRPAGSQVAGPRLPLVSDLTARECEVLEMLSEGLMARSIAQRLEVSERTVHKHLGNLYRKLDAHDRLLAVRRAETLGLIPAEIPIEIPTELPAQIPTQVPTQRTTTRW